MRNPLNNLPKPFFILAPMDDVTDTVFRQIIATLPYASHVDGMQGNNEKRTSRTNGTVSESRKQLTQQSATSTSGVSGSADEQAGAVRRYGPDLYFTEFVNVDGLQSPGREKLLPKLRFTDKERPIVAQIWGKNPENYYKTARQLVDGSLIDEIERLRTKGGYAVQGSQEERAKRTNGTESERLTPADTAMRPKRGGMSGFAGQQASANLRFAGVDINFGCPDKTVVKNGLCIAMINNRELTGEIIQAVREGVGPRFPVSVKTRLGLNEVDFTWHEFLLKQKLNMLTIHGRTAKQMSKVPADWNAIEHIRKMRDSLSPSTLIVGNGDVDNKTHGSKLAAQYSLDGIMIGRGVLTDPFAFAESSPWPEWSKQQKLELYKKHVELFAKTWSNGERKLHTLNKFCKLYIQGFDGAKEQREQLMQAKSTEELLTLLT